MWWYSCWKYETVSDLTASEPVTIQSGCWSGSGVIAKGREDIL